MLIALINLPVRVRQFTFSRVQSKPPFQRYSLQIAYFAYCKISSNRKQP